MTRPNISNNTGRGKDRKGTKRDGLRFHWRWLEQCMLSQAPADDRRRLPCQVCAAEMTTAFGYFELEAVDWHDEYEARVSVNDNTLAHENGLRTRLAAQLRAESLLREFCESTLEELYA